MHYLLPHRLKQHENFERLGRRKDGFYHIARHVEFVYANKGLNQIIETGTARQFNNWEGDGQSTLIWDFFMSILSVRAISIDIDGAAISLAKSQVINPVEFIVGDSVNALTYIPDSTLNKTALLYLDSFDWSPETHEQSSKHHLKELMVVWNRLPEGCLIVVDDCHSDTQGKHIAVKEFFNSMGVPPLFVGYQTGWVKW